MLKFIELPDIDKESISNGIKKIDPDLSEIDNLNFCYIDMGKTSESQKDLLVGLFNRVFYKKVTDHRAAVDVMIGLFRDIETTFNQGNKSKLLDKSKRLESEKVNDAIKIITTRSKAFNVWREKKGLISEILKIPNRTNMHEEFELHFENSFDYFKDR